MAKITNESYNPFQELDDVLIILATSTSQQSFGLPELSERDNLPKYSLNSIKPIVQKLIKDGYIQQEGDAYSITFEGKLFVQKGGYTQQAKNDSAESIRLDKIDIAQKNFRYIQNGLLILVAVGTLAAGAYYVIEIGKHFHWWK